MEGWAAAGGRGADGCGGTATQKPMYSKAAKYRQRYITAPRRGGALARVFWPVFESGGCVMKEIEKVDFKDEKTLHDTIRKNLGVIFPSLEIVGDEVSLEDGKIDTVGFNKGTHSFVLIEYKKGKKEGALEQLLGYLGDMDRHKGDFLRACGRKRGRATWDSENIAWDKCKGILMAPSFTKHQFNVAKNHRQIELHRIFKYEDKILMIEMVEGQKPRGGQEPGIDDAQMLYNELESILVHNLDLKKIEMSAYHKWVLPTNDKKVVCTVALQKKSLVLCYTTKSLDIDDTDRVFVRRMIENGEKVGKRGRGSYMSKIHNMEDVNRAVGYLEEVQRQKAENPLNQKRQTHRNLSKQDDMAYVTQRGASERTRRLYSEFKRALLKNIPNLEIVVKKKYMNWKSTTNGASIFTIAVNKNALRLSYNTKRLDIPKNDDFVRRLNDNGKRISVAGLGKYDSKIETNVDVKNAIHYIKKVHAEKVV